MSWWLPLCVLAVWVLASSATEERKVHRLVGGHLRIFHEDPYDGELLEALASGAKGKKSHKGDDEEKKTLSQQVADGKYGLIQKEIFAKPSKRPGVLSYDNNPEIPKDNINNLGGLTKNDIWLAENHLLVLKGGTYPPHNDKNDNAATAWPAIDDYKAPLRQVKIPAHPKVPPPFPVQLTDDGPLQILGTNSSRTINGSFDQATFAVPPPEGFEPGPYLPPPYPYPPNATSGKAPQPIPAFPSGEYLPGSPFPPFNLNGTLPPFFASLPPGAAILPPPNQTEPFDEDDPSIYYPPPYSFYYPKDNSSIVPAGPLVPGIILPPPPDFFAPLEEETTKKPATTGRKPSRHRVKTTTTPLPQIHPTTTAIPPTSVLNDKTTRKPLRILPVHIPAEINNELKPIVTTVPPKVVTVLSVRPKVTKNNRTPPPRTHKTRPPTVTILKPVKPSTVPPKVYVYDNEVSGVYRPPSRVKTVVSTTQVPLKVYYSTANDIETNSITHSPEKYRIGVSNSRRAKTTTKSPQYYYYEEQRGREVTTRKPFYDIPKEYYIPAKQSNLSPPIQQQKYIYVPTRPYNTQRPRYRFVEQTPKTDSFSIHIARLQKQIHQYYTTPRPTYRPTQTSKPVYQFSFQASNYRQPQEPELEDSQDRFRPLPKYSVQIQPAIEIIPTEAPIYKNTPRPSYYQVTTERPAPSKYYTTQRPDYEYEEYVDEKNKNVPSARPVSQYTYEVTPNPIYQGFYTKPDEGYFDENTKEYFTTFGQKIASGTTPMPQLAESGSAQRQRRPEQYQEQRPAQYQQQRPEQYQQQRPEQYQQQRPEQYQQQRPEQYQEQRPVQYQQQRPEQYQQQRPEQYQQQRPDQYQQHRPVSLEGDTDVNYLPPRPTINPDSEFVPVNSNQQRINYPQEVKYAPRPAQYAQETRQKNRGAEIVKAVPVNVPTAEGQPGSFISYQLPGDDGAHFYFLTPQLAQSRDQGAGFYYSQPNVARIRRNKER